MRDYKNKRTKNEEIIGMILDGKRCSEICKIYLYTTTTKLIPYS